MRECTGGKIYFKYKEAAPPNKQGVILSASARKMQATQKTQELARSRAGQTQFLTSRLGFLQAIAPLEYAKHGRPRAKG